LSHVPLPHVEQTPQSCGQLTQFSVALSQTPSPQVGQLPQSWGQPRQVSPGSQTPLPHVEQNPQSIGQLLQVSPGSQVPLPHERGGGATPSGNPPSGTGARSGFVRSARAPHAETMAESSPMSGSAKKSRRSDMAGA
jgi:hypothetical protein